MSEQEYTNGFFGAYETFSQTTDKGDDASTKKG